MELKKNFITKRGIWIYLLMLAPAFITWMHSIIALTRGNQGHDLSRDTVIMATLFQVFLLRPAIFLGCVGIFTYLFRGEMVERSLHYYFLAPVRREVLTVAKYLAGLITACTFFGGSTLLTFAGVYAHYDNVTLNEFFMNGEGIRHAVSYLAATLLACAGWGAVCLWMGIVWRNPIVPAVTFLLWESANPFLPSWMQRLSVLHYVQALVPVQGDFQGTGNLIFGATPNTPAVWVAIPTILIATAVVLLLAAKQLKRTEISYSSD
jgi:ABC-type transport system involved in multi-copper enzyme maturation permease subunit